MNVEKEIELLCNVLKLSETELGNKLGVTYETINNWKHSRKNIDDKNLGRLYEFAYTKGIKFNQIFEQLLKEENNTNDSLVLFHGAKKEFNMPIDINSNSKRANDFGIGFYLGEKYEQAANYISTLNSNRAYAFNLNLTNLKTYRFDVSSSWMIAIAYYRGWLNKYCNHKVILDILKNTEKVDVIIAPIADNRMYDIITNFIESEITDEQCKHSLAATNLGYQYVLKTEKAINNTTYLKELFVCNDEKDSYKQRKEELMVNGIQKAKMARIEYKSKGKYIEEILK